MDASTTSIIIQIVAGIVFTYIIYVISLFTVRADKLSVQTVHVTSGKQEVPIVRGVLSTSEVSSGSADNKWNTTVPFLFNYLPITPSTNNRGGAQFSYAFWLYVGNPQDALGKALFLKGDAHRYVYEVRERHFDHLRGEEVLGNAQRLRERAIFCPLFSFGSDNLEFDVSFNTLHNMNQTMKIKRIRSENTLQRHNLHGLFPKSWFHITVVFEDNVPINDFEQGLLVRFYINSTMYQMEKYNTTLKQNRGNFVLFPDGPIKDTKISNLSYFNYALTEDEIRNRISHKPDHSKTSAKSKDSIQYTFDTGVRNENDTYNI